MPTSASKITRWRNLESTMRDSLTVSRANHFVAALPGKKGAQY